MENLCTTLLNNVVHQFNQVRLEIGLLVFLIIGEGLDHVVYKFFKGLSADLILVTTTVEGLKEFFDVGLALRVGIWTID